MHVQRRDEVGRGQMVRHQLLLLMLVRLQVEVGLEEVAGDLGRRRRRRQVGWGGDGGGGRRRGVGAVHGRAIDRRHLAAAAVAVGLGQGTWETFREAAFFFSNERMGWDKSKRETSSLLVVIIPG